jgi:hypothetical protein
MIQKLKFQKFKFENFFQRRLVMRSETLNLCGLCGQVTQYSIGTTHDCKAVPRDRKRGSVTEEPQEKQNAWAMAREWAVKHNAKST